MSNVISLPTPIDTSHGFESRWVTRLGGKEWQIRCSCGMTISHRDPSHAQVAVRLYHEALHHPAFEPVFPGGRS